MRERCPWFLNNLLNLKYHDEEWGVPIFDDTKLFEYLTLEGAQAGLSWSTILKKRGNYRIAFDQFNAQKIAQYGPSKIYQLLHDPGIVCNRFKIEGTVKNARVFLKIQERKGSFASYIWKFVDGKPLHQRPRRLQDISTTTPLSDTLSKTLKKEGFTFVGSRICYAFMQAVGMVNDHLAFCYRQKEIEALV